MAKTLDRIKHAWNAFTSEGKFTMYPRDIGPNYGTRPDRNRMRISNERSIIASIFVRLGIDIASVDIRHVRMDQNERYVETIYSGLNNCLTIEANIDQAARHFRQDIAMTLFDKGVLAIVPVDTTLDPKVTGSYDILSMRIGEILDWYPKHIRVRLYDESDGKMKEIIVPKATVAIIENPLYSVMNEPNSTLKRLINKLNMLDAVDEQSSSGKLDLIIQLPYVIKSQARKDQADQRRLEIETQLKNSKYGIAYADGTEKITQLNRPAENNLLKQVEYLTAMLYGQLGVTDAVINGTADEATMLNYHNRTVDPILGAIAEGMKRAFLTKTARTQLQSIMYFRDPFKWASVKDLSEIADKFTRNAIVTSNEFRSIIGLKPSKDPKADELSNKNMPDPAKDPAKGPKAEPDQPAPKEEEGKLQNGV